jgi:hypothetical protein
MTEREMLIYWLLKSYRALNRVGWEEGLNESETSDCLCSVLANLDYDPNLSPRAKELESRPH